VDEFPLQAKPAASRLFHRYTPLHRIFAQRKREHLRGRKKRRKVTPQSPCVVSFPKESIALSFLLEQEVELPHVKSKRKGNVASPRNPNEIRSPIGRSRRGETR
jgi:hypothetical protein